MQRYANRLTDLFAITRPLFPRSRYRALIAQRLPPLVNSSHCRLMRGRFRVPFLGYSFLMCKRAARATSHCVASAWRAGDVASVVSDDSSKVASGSLLSMFAAVRSERLKVSGRCEFRETLLSLLRRKRRGPMSQFWLGSATSLFLSSRLLRPSPCSDVAFQSRCVASQGFEKPREGERRGSASATSPAFMARLPASSQLPTTSFDAPGAYGFSRCSW